MSLKVPEKSIKTWDFVGDSLVLKTPVFQVLKRAVISPKDSCEKIFAVIDAPDWVNVLALTPQNQVVLVNQYRQGSKSFSLELPGGVTETGDSLLETAQRELMEETGYSATGFFPFLQMNPNPALFGNRITTFLAREACPTGTTSFDENEETEVSLVSLKELKQKLLDSTIDHALMIAAISYFLLTRPDLNASSLNTSSMKR
ncbi:MAG: NUDIX hydrolase [Deltaproteobacteria bacterium]|jgi:8-oxo-dGTP pyrophosphatase MutT (NUDIX family)|nr:NUDIX hydrolase [Deltaproteobacteria bacterium]